jgi:hypothetical protein
MSAIPVTTASVKRVRSKSRGYTLAELLLQPRVPPTWLFHDWMLEGQRNLLWAPAGAGKTTLMGNVARSLLDGDLYLGEALVQPLAPGKRLLWFNFDMLGGQWVEWAGDQAIKNTDSLYFHDLKSHKREFNLEDAKCRQEWTDLFIQQNGGAFVLDSVTNAMSPFKLNASDNGDVYRWTNWLDEVLDDAGVTSGTWVLHHTGHDTSRFRGATAFVDWCDVETWIAPLSKGTKLRAHGRDVDQLKGRELQYDKQSRRYALVAPGSPTSMPPISISQMAPPKVPLEELALGDCITLLRSVPRPLSASMVIQLLKGKRAVGWQSHSDASVRAGLKLGAQLGTVVETKVGRELQYAAVPP